SRRIQPPRLLLEGNRPKQIAPRRVVRQLHRDNSKTQAGGSGGSLHGKNDAVSRGLSNPRRRNERTFLVYRRSLRRERRTRYVFALALLNRPGADRIPNSASPGLRAAIGSRQTRYLLWISPKR